MCKKNRNILIDCLHIKESGAKVLLIRLLEELIETKDLTILLDKTIVLNKKLIEKHKIIRLKSSLINRLFFYLKNNNFFSKIITFNNLPPFFNSKTPSYVYFHNTLFIEKKIIYIPLNKNLFYYQKKYL